MEPPLDLTGKISDVAALEALYQQAQDESQLSTSCERSRLLSSC